MQSERRRSKRVPLVVELYYRFQNPPELKIRFKDRIETAYLVDLSTTGIGFLCGSELPVNSELDITFNLLAPGGGSAKIRSAGVVRYCSFQDDRQVFRIGVVFTVIDEQEEKMIEEFVKNIKSEGV